MLLHRNSNPRNSISYLRGTANSALSSKGTRPVTGYITGAQETCDLNEVSPCIFKRDTDVKNITKASEFPKAVCYGVTQGDQPYCLMQSEMLRKSVL